MQLCNRCIDFITWQGITDVDVAGCSFPGTSPPSECRLSPVEHCSRIRYHPFQARQGNYSNWLISEGLFSVSRAFPVVWQAVSPGRPKLQTNEKLDCMWLQYLSQLIPLTYYGILSNFPRIARHCTVPSRQMRQWPLSTLARFRSWMDSTSCRWRDDLGHYTCQAAQYDWLFMRNAIVLIILAAAIAPWPLRW